MCANSDGRRTHIQWVEITVRRNRKRWPYSCNIIIEQLNYRSLITRTLDSVKKMFSNRGLFSAMTAWKSENPFNLEKIPRCKITFILWQHTVVYLFKYLPLHWFYLFKEHIAYMVPLSYNLILTFSRFIHLLSVFECKISHWLFYYFLILIFFN